MRARADLTRTWEAAHALPCLYGGAGMGAQRAAWQVSYRAEVAARNRLEYGQTLLDLVKAFEKIPHEHLIAAGKKHGYNGCCLRLALAAYRLVRSIGIDGAYSRTRVAVLGITAGSGFATAELRLLLFDVVTELTCSWPLLMISLYVDDLTLEATHSSKYQVMYMLTAATDHVVNHLQHRLQLEVSAKKSVTVAGRPSIAAGVAGLSRMRKVSARSSTKLLGVASAGWRRRSVNVLKLRIKHLALRTPRIRALRRAGLSATRLVRAAGTPLVTYGADVTGMSCSHLRTARCAVARAVSAPGGGKSHNAILFAVDAATGTLDPAFDAHVLPMKMLALAWWQRWQPAASLNAAVRHARHSALRDGSPLCTRHRPHRRSGCQCGTHWVALYYGFHRGVR